MRDDLPSVTALLVAFARGAAASHPMTHPPLRDEVTRALLPGPLPWLLPRASGPFVARHPRSAWLLQSAMRAASLGLVDEVALRTAALDAVVDEARRDGVAQVVILGAGLDARAYRLASLAGASVFEVDHPATQPGKRRAAAGLTALCRRLEHVALDLDRGGLADALAASGHDPSAPTCWLAEGLLMYLPRETTRATLAAIGACSAPGSRVAMTYMRTERVVLPAPLLRLASSVVARIGEPLRGTFEPAEMAAELTALGFVVTDDANATDWAARFGSSPLVPALFRSERLVAASLPRR